jgi:hypothetical protein
MSHGWRVVVIGFYVGIGKFVEDVSRLHLKAMDRNEGFSSRRNSSTGSDFEIPFCASFWNYCFRNYQGQGGIN